MFNLNIVITNSIGKTRFFSNIPVNKIAMHDGSTNENPSTGGVFYSSFLLHFITTSSLKKINLQNTSKTSLILKKYFYLMKKNPPTYTNEKIWNNPFLLLIGPCSC